MRARPATKQSMIKTTAPLSLHAGQRPLLEGIEFALNEGEIMLIKGPNGVGKTTLLRAIAGLHDFTQGAVQYDPDLLIYTGHKNALKDQLTTRENLEFWAEIQGVSQYPDLLEMLDLTPFIDRAVKTLSAGQKRRLSLARAFLAPNRLLIMDEPTTSMDSQNTKRIANLIKDAAKAGSTIVLTSHVSLDLGTHQTLDLEDYIAKTGAQDIDPFLEGSF